jgi:hypothetical protein
MRGGLVVLSVTAVVVLGGWLVGGGRQPEPAVTGLRASGAAPAGYTVSDWVEVPPVRAETLPLPATLQAIGDELGCRNPVRTTTAATFVRWNVRCQVGAVATRLTAERFADGTVYLVVDRAVAGTLANLSWTAAVAEAVLTPWHPVHAGVTVEGWIPGLVSRSAARALVANVLGSLGAHEVNGVAAQEWVSVAAYGPRCGPSLSLGRQPVNLEVAVVRDLVNRRTEVLVGTPLIAVTY